jgi:hypothetical protein
MPITLNHSNIGVQYSSDKSYIIETVKSDLYRRNEIIDTITRDNIQIAPVTPSIYIENGTNNVYAVESYTYYGSANTADFTRVFTKSTTCDILVVGGGGGGGKRHGGGGGAGTLMYHKNIILNGTYNIKVGKGGNPNPASSGINTGDAGSGNFSQFVKSDGTQNYYAVGGGRGASGGTSYATTNGGQGYLYDANITLSTGNIFNSVAVSVSNKQYVNTLTLPEGCRGNVGGREITRNKGAGGGGAGSAGMDHDEETTANDGYSGLGLAIDITGTSVVYAGGGNGSDFSGTLSQVFNPLYPTIQSRGGGGFGSDTGSPQNGLDGTGGGGGGSGVEVTSGAGGAGIVIIRYLLGTIPSTNFLTSEPTVISPVMTESIRSFIHSGGTEAQTTHTITVGQNTICDILIVGGGGGGSAGHGGGGGAGQLVLIHQAILSGTYTIKVGKGGNGTTLSGTSSVMGTITNGTKGSNSEFGNASINVIAEGGGVCVDTTLRDGGSGAGGDGHTPDGGVGGRGLKNTTIDTFSSGIVYSRGNNGGDGSAATNNNAGQGGGGGGAGAVGTTGGQNNDSTIGHGGDGLSGITEISYDFKNNFGNYGKLEADGNYWFAGGGAGGTYYGNSSVISNGGKGGGGSTPASVNNTKINGGSGVNGTGGGGAGGSAWYGNGGNGGSGIVIIRFKSIANVGILDGITHKRLNLSFDSLGFCFDATKYIEYQTQLKTGVGGWRIVRYLPPNTGRWYQGNYINTSTFTIPTIGTPYNYTNEWAVSFGTFDEMFFATFDLTYWLHCLKSAVLGVYDQTARPVIKSSTRNFAHTVLWINRTVTTVNQEDPWISINDHLANPALMLYGENSNTANFQTLLNGFGGMCVLVRDSATGTTIPNPNTYTLNFPVPTTADINNNSNIVLRGAYDIALSTTNSLIIPKAGQYIPKPTTFSTSNLSIRYNILNPILDTTGAQWTYNTSNTNVYHMGSVGVGTTSPEYQLDVRGTLNAKTYYFNGVQIGRLSEGMVANVQHLTYTHMEIKNNTGWDAINDDLTTGFVISITPKSNLSKILVNLIAHIGLTNAVDGRWWGIKLYRKIGTAAWTEVTGPNGTETGSAANTNGTPVWISNNIGATTASYPYQIINLTGTYLDSPNTTSTVYYTAYWNQLIGANPSATGNLWLNRAANQDDAWRPAPSSSWTLKEIWYG